MKGNNAEEEGWGQGQPSVLVMNRQIKVLKRWGYNPKDDTQTNDKGDTNDEQDENRKTVTTEVDVTAKAEDGASVTESAPSEPPLWGLDLEALRSNNYGNSRDKALGNPALPIYTPQSARGYLIHSFSTSMVSSGTDTKQASPKKRSASVINAEKERNLAALLRALDLLFDSWAHVLSIEELDKRAWAWYVHTRPEVQDGVAGWGGKGEVKLASILSLRRKV